MTTEVAKPEQRKEVSIRDRMLSAADRVQAAIGNAMDARRCLLIAAMQIEGDRKLLEVATTQDGIRSIVSSVAKAALYGWEIGGPGGDAYLVPFNLNVGKRGEQQYVKKAQLIPGYKGLRALVRRSGECETICETVHEGDKYEFRGPFEQPVHVRSQDLDRRTKPVTHAYVLAYFFRTHTFKCVSWSAQECIAHRDQYSQNWENALRYAKGDESKLTDNPWHPSNPAFGVMCMKTVCRFAINRGELPISVQDRTIAQHDDESPKAPVTIDVDAMAAVESLDEEDPVARAIDQHGADETRPSPGVNIDEFRESLVACTSIADVNRCEKEFLTTSATDDERLNVEAECQRMREHLSEQRPRGRK
jgi:phage RecT family recombinase